MSHSRSIDDILTEFRQQRDNNPDLYIPVPTDTQRTLLLIGPTRAGKSTIAKTLQDSLYQPPKPTLFSATRSPEHQQIGGLRIIDMPGFNDFALETTNSLLSNHSIFSMLQKELKGNEPVHVVAFVFSLSNGIKQEDINMMINVQSTLPELANRMMLIITRAEELNNQEKNTLVKDFFEHPNVKRHDLRNFFKRGVLFFGCLRYESWNQRDYAALVREHDNVLEMRRTLIERCFQSISLPTNNPSAVRINPAVRFIRPIGYTIGICTLVAAVCGFFSLNSKLAQNTRLLEKIIQHSEAQSHDMTVMKDVFYLSVIEKIYSLKKN